MQNKLKKLPSKTNLELVNSFGGKEQYLKAVNELENLLYSVNF